MSTESGIPDYRDELGRWKQPQPMQFRQFVSSPQARRSEAPRVRRSGGGRGVLRGAPPRPYYRRAQPFESFAFTTISGTAASALEIGQFAFENATFSSNSA